MKTKVVVTDYTFDNLEFEKNILVPLGCEVTGQQKYRDPESLKALVAEADFVITQFAPVKAEIIAAMRRCRVICRYGIGVDNVDLQAAAAKKIPVCNVPDYCIDEVADHTLAMILSLTRQIPLLSSRVRQGDNKLPFGVEKLKVLCGMNIGVIGFGRIGRGVAHRLASFKSRVLVYDPGVNAKVIQSAGFTPADLSQIFKESDLITLHCPSTAQTRNMINSESFAKIKKGVLLVNISRGDLVNTDDLTAALRSGAVGAAGLDVTSPEPLSKDHPLLQMDNVIITGHIASASVNAVQQLRTGVTKPIIALLRNESPTNIVNGITV